MGLLKKFLINLAIAFLVIAVVITIYASIETKSNILSDVNNQVDSVNDKVQDVLTVTDNIKLQRVTNSMRLLKQRGLSLGKPTQRGTVNVRGTIAPNLFLGDVGQGNNFDLVDGLTEIMDGTATIFSRSGDDYIRIATNVIKDGNRAIGTKLSPTGKAIKKINNKEAYYGQVDILGMPFLTAYEPIFNANGDVIGIWYVGYSADMEVLEAAISSERILDTGFVALLDSKGTVRIHSDHLATDTIQDIIESRNDDWTFSESIFPQWNYKLVIAYPKAEVSELVFSSVSVSIMIVIIGAGLLMAIVYYLVLTVVSKPLRYYIDSINEIADGEADLTVRFEPQDIEEFTQMGLGFNRLLERLQISMRDVFNLMTRLNGVVQQLSTAADTSHKIASDLSSETEEVASSIVEMSSTASSLEDNTRIAEDAAEEAGNHVKTSVDVINESISATQKQSEELVLSMDVIKELENASNNIGGVMDVISNIAEQTNLLALNAAIEAARAGEQGRGFAVVADEVRSLASRTQASTSEIHNMIEKLQEGSKKASNMIERNKDLAVNNAEKTSEAGNALQSALTKVEQIILLNQQNSHSSQQQSITASNMASRTESISGAGDKNKVTADEVNNLTNELNDLAGKLEMILATYKL
jgi:methyl-accepting chemotaxis protein